MNRLVNTLDYSLYLVTDQALSKGRTHHEIVDAAVQGGVTCVQLREKESSTREIIEQARILKKLLARHQGPLIINDRLDVALVVGADGVHLGQTDMHINDARQLTPPEMIIGISVESAEHAVQAEKQGADYIGISPVFSTTTKTDTVQPLGLAGVRDIRELVDLPIVGIGGIGASNVGEVLSAGADGVAVVSAIVNSDCPKTAAANLKKKISSASY